MKNIITIDIDDERDIRLKINKPERITKPESSEEAKEMVKNDMQTLCEGLETLIKVSNANGYINKEDSVALIKKYLDNI